MDKPNKKGFYKGKVKHKLSGAVTDQIVYWDGTDFTQNEWKGMEVISFEQRSWKSEM